MTLNAQDQSAKDLIVRDALETIFANGSIPSDLVVGPLETHDFSYCISLIFRTPDLPYGAYIKIPKADLYRKNTKSILPLTDEDRELARQEYRSLSYINRTWHKVENGARYVSPIAFMERHNAVITERIHGTDFTRILRREALHPRYRETRAACPTRRHISAIGVSLRSFHDGDRRNSVFTGSHVGEKMRHYLSVLHSVSAARDRTVNLIEDTLRPVSAYKTEVDETNTLKGLDVRNVIADSQGSTVLVDPGRMKRSVPQEDLARFIVTCRILYWGSPALFLRMTPSCSYEQSFLSAYYGSPPLTDDPVTSILILKELLKHWQLAHVALQLKEWPNLLKGFLRDSYVNPFYKITCEKECRHLRAII